MSEFHCWILSLRLRNFELEISALGSPISMGTTPFSNPSGGMKFPAFSAGWFSPQLPDFPLGLRLIFRHCLTRDLVRGEGAIFVSGSKHSWKIIARTNVSLFFSLLELKVIFDIQNFMNCFALLLKHVMKFNTCNSEASHKGTYTLLKSAARFYAHVAIL